MILLSQNPSTAPALALRRRNGKMQSFHAKDHFDHISVWYPRLAQYTFQTEFVTLNSKDADALASYRSRAREIGSMYSFVGDDPEALAKLKKLDPLDQ